MPKRIHETVAAVEAAPTSTPGRFRVRIISAGVGSSGHYPAPTLKDAVERKVWRAGTHVYMDHPGRTEDGDRPERTLRDLVGVLADDAEWNAEESAAEADVRVYSQYRQLLEEMSDDVGLSIRAIAEATPGEVNGKPMPIITRILEALSVDFVTRAGRGGRVLAVLESARPATEAATSDRRDQLQRALQATYGDLARDRYPWLRDFDDVARVVWYEDGRETWQQPYTVADDDLSVTITGQRFEVRPVTTYHPVNSAGEVGESTPSTQEEQHMPQIEEARLAELTAAANRVTALEAERDSAIQRAEAAEADARTVAREAYTAQVTAALAASNLPTPARERVADTLALGEADTVPATPGAVIEAAIQAERDYAASLAPALGKVESPRRLGFGAAPEPVTESYTNPWGRTINPVKEA